MQESTRVNDSHNGSLTRDEAWLYVAKRNGRDELARLGRQAVRWTGKAGCWGDKGTANCVNWDKIKACRLACAGSSDIGRPTWITGYDLIGLRAIWRNIEDVIIQTPRYPSLLLRHIHPLSNTLLGPSSSTRHRTFEVR